MKKNNQDKKRTKKIILFTKIVKISLMIILLFSFYGCASLPLWSLLLYLPPLININYG